MLQIAAIIVELLEAHTTTAAAVAAHGVSAHAAHGTSTHATAVAASVTSERLLVAHATTAHATHGIVAHTAHGATAHGVAAHAHTGTGTHTGTSTSTSSGTTATELVQELLAVTHHAQNAQDLAFMLLQQSNNLVHGLEGNWYYFLLKCQSGACEKETCPTQLQTRYHRSRHMSLKPRKISGIIWPMRLGFVGTCVI